MKTNEKKIEKLKKAWATAEDFIKIVLGENLWQKQIEIVNSVERNKRTAVRTCHGIGKTRVASSIALTYLYRHKDSMVITTAPTWRQVYQQLWREIRGRHHNARIELPGNKFLTPRYELSENWYGVGLSTKEPEKFQGYHAPFCLVIADEASGIDPKIFEAIHGIMASGDCRLLLLGNPTQASGEFYNAFHDSRTTYNTIHVSAFDTPNLLPYREQYERLQWKDERIAFLRSLKPELSYLVNAEYIADMLEEFGEDSSIYKVRVLGEFPADSPHQLMTLSWVEAAVRRWETLKGHGEKPPENWEADLSGRWNRWSDLQERWWECENYNDVVIGADIARMGGCETVIAARQGSVVAPLHIYTQQKTTTTSGCIIRHATTYQARQVNIDATGIGAGVFDLCVDEGLNGCNEIISGAGAFRPDKFLNRRAEMYWHLRTLFEQGLIAIPKDNRLIGQLSSIEYDTTRKGQIKIESKEEYKARMSGGSPDRADAVCLAMIPDASENPFEDYYPAKKAERTDDDEEGEEDEEDESTLGLGLSLKDLQSWE